MTSCVTRNKVNLSDYASLALYILPRKDLFTQEC